jgi:cell division protein FtsQ
MKLRTLHISKGLKVILFSATVLSAIGFAERSAPGDVCNDILVEINNQHENYFVDDQDVIQLITNNGQRIVNGRNFAELDLKEMEIRLKEEYFIGDAEIYKDLKGNMLVSVDLQRPMARIIRQDGPHAYVAEDGSILPVSEKFTARTVLISGDVTELLKQPLSSTEEGMKLYELLHYIYQDEFLKAQIAQIHIGKGMDITLYPQVTKQYIEFGEPEDIEEKFKKLKIFYKKILPAKGWNAYERVNVKFKDQIIAE